MKRIPLIALLLPLTLSLTAQRPLFSVESEMSDLERELLSLEHEFLDSFETAGPGSDEQVLLFDSDEASPVSEGSSDFLSFESELPASPSETEPEDSSNAASSVPIRYPHEEKIRPLHKEPVEIDLRQAFAGSPFIYSLLLGMSFTSIAVCLYTVFRVRQQILISAQFSEKVKKLFLEGSFEETENLCKNHPNWLSKIIASGFSCKKYGFHAILENMKSEGKRASLSAWQRLGILQDIAIISPMLGLLGTVIGLFYAFYDLNRSFDSIGNLIDGLGISVGTTVAGICVSILSMILHSIAKFRLIRSLARIELEAHDFARLIDEHK